MGQVQFDEFGRVRLSDDAPAQNSAPAPRPRSYSQPAPTSYTPPARSYTAPARSTSSSQPTSSSSPDDQTGLIVAWCIGGVVGLVLLCCFWYIILPAAAVIGIIAGLCNDSSRPVILWILGIAAAIFGVVAIGAIVINYWPVILVILIILAICSGG